MTGERRHRRAVGPAGATPVEDEPRQEPASRRDEPSDDERFLQERPPHHEPKD